MPTPLDYVDALEAIPGRFATPDPSSLSQIPKGNVKLDYMGHADVTLALIAVDPCWNWEPVAIDPETAGPVVSKQGNRLVMWGYLTVYEKRLLCVGTCEANKFEPEKELIGDLIRNGAMRFGIATSLWSKAAKAGDHSADPYGSGGAGGYDRAEPVRGPSEAARTLYDRVRGLAGTPTADALKADATANNRKLTASAFDSDPEWFAIVEAHVTAAQGDNQ